MILKRKEIQVLFTTIFMMNSSLDVLLSTTEELMSKAARFASFYTWHNFGSVLPVKRKLVYFKLHQITTTHKTFKNELEDIGKKYPFP
jgi:hypothetical protein